MRLAIVHLSDLHIRTSSEPILRRATAIANSIKSVSQEDIEIIVAWTGDIAYSGKADEYSLATTFIDEVESALRANPQIRFLGSTFVPGNHDCDFSLSGDARSPLLETLPAHIDQIVPSGDIVQQITRPQEMFFNFLQSRGVTALNRLFWEAEFNANQTKVLVRCCNSAWTSQLPEKPTLLFPSQLIAESASPLTISLIHHPFSWFEPTNGKALRRKLEIDSDLILTGHEHDPDAFLRAGSSSSTHYLEASALSAANVQTGFTVSLVDMPDSTIHTFVFDWKDPLYERSAEFTFPFVRKQRAIVNRFLRSLEFEKILEEITTPYTHPRKDLRLSDIYVPLPLVEILPSADGKTTEQAIPAEGVIDFILTEKLLRISAPTGYGKSALARTLCRELLDRASIVSVFLEPDLIAGHDINRLSGSVERAFCKQYGPHLLENFRQLDKSQKAIVFDDWDRLRYNDNGRNQLLKNLVMQTDHLVIFDDVSSFVQQMNDISAALDIPRLKLCEIRQFGYKLRGDLIERWHQIGRALEVAEDVFAHDVSVSERVLDALIGRGIMPSTPLYILSALQMQHEASNSGGDYGSYGHIYQSLITSRLSKQSNRQVALKINFLSMLSFRMFEAQADSLSATQVKEIAEHYENDYSYPIDWEPLLNEIAASGLIYFDGQTFKFEYRYAYYYSVANAFRTNVANEQTRQGARQHLTRLASEAYYDDNANILIFYIYLSKDRTLIEEILSNAKSIYASVTPCNLEGDVAFINALLKQPLALEEPSQNVSKNVVDHRLARDQAGDAKIQSDTTLASATEISEIDFALRSLEIMGQVLKNFPTDLRRDLKLSLTKESYSLGLRVMGSLLYTLQQNRDKYRQLMTARLSTENAFSAKTFAKQQEMVDGIIIFFAELGIYGVLKKVSDALGTEDLRHTYDEVRSQLGEDQVATRLIDLSIRLDHFGILPETDIFDLEKRLRENKTAWTILSMLVGQHIALFPTNWRVRQRFLDTFRFGRTTGLPSPKQILPK